MDNSVPAPRVRRPQAERSATTRAKVMDAAISCLHDYGFSLTSTSLVAERAGVSRGGMIHQFPTKRTLMLAVVQEVFERDAALYKKSLTLASPAAWIQTLPSTIWEVISAPSGIAVIEIMLASRADLELANELRAIQQEIDKRAHQWIVERQTAAGLVEHPEGEAIHRLVVAAMRGLALEAVFMRNRSEVERSIAVLTQMLRQFYPEASQERQGSAQ